jgi:sugar (pentulose or hexulose) kinase
MGGREFSLLMEGHSQDWAEGDVADVLARKTILLPSTQPGSGPFPHRAAQWRKGDRIADQVSGGQRFVAVSFYLALTTAVCLDLTGADGPVIVEGPFARNRLFTRMLAAATKRVVIASDAATGTSIGAALLAAGNAAKGRHGDIAEPAADGAWSDYVRCWHAALCDQCGAPKLPV